MPILLRYGVILALIVLWVWALANAISVQDDSMYQTGNKLIWVLVILLAGPLGALLYWAMGRPERPRPPTRRPPEQPPLDDII